MELAVASLILGVVGTGMSVMSSVQQARSEEAAARTSARAAEMEAESARESAAFEERQFRRKAQHAIGKQRAITAASGVDPSTGSPLLQELDFARQAEIEALNIRRGGELSATGSEFESALQRQKAGQARRGVGFAIGKGVARTGSILTEFLSEKK
jgi:hypothetical protein